MKPSKKTVNPSKTQLNLVKLGRQMVRCDEKEREMKETPPKSATGKGRCQPSGKGPGDGGRPAGRRPTSASRASRRPRRSSSSIGTTARAVPWSKSWLNNLHFFFLGARQSSLKFHPSYVKRHLATEWTTRQYCPRATLTKNGFIARKANKIMETFKRNIVTG